MTIKLSANHFYNLTIVEVDYCEYAMGTLEESLKAAKEYISDSVWCFNPSFLVSHSSLSEKAIKAIQENLDEADATEAIKATIKDFDHFVDDAISADGLGHFLASYDGEEEKYSDWLEENQDLLEDEDLAILENHFGDVSELLVFRTN